MGLRDHLHGLETERERITATQVMDELGTIGKEPIPQTYIRTHQLWRLEVEEVQEVVRRSQPFTPPHAAPQPTFTL